MEIYKGYQIKKTGEFFEVCSPSGKYLRNALTVAIAKEYIDLMER